MTRARARALETEVTSLLSEITYDPLETWLLPKSETLCMIRYQEDPPEDAREGVQAPSSWMKSNYGRCWGTLHGKQKNSTHTQDLSRRCIATRGGDHLHALVDL